MKPRSCSILTCTTAVFGIFGSADAQSGCGVCIGYHGEMLYEARLLGSASSWEPLFARSVASAVAVTAAPNPTLCGCGQTSTSLDGLSSTGAGSLLPCYPSPTSSCSLEFNCGEYEARASSNTYPPTIAGSLVMRLVVFQGVTPYPSQFDPCIWAFWSGLAWARATAEYNVRYVGSGSGLVSSLLNVSGEVPGELRQGISRTGVRLLGTTRVAWQSTHGVKLDGLISQNDDYVAEVSTQVSSNSTINLHADAFAFTDSTYDVNEDGRFNELDEQQLDGLIGSTDLHIIQRFDFDHDGVIDSEDVSVLSLAIDDSLGSGLFGDWNHDGMVNCLDRPGLSYFGYSLGQSGYIIELDFDLDGDTDHTDMSHFDACVPTADYDRDSGVTIDDFLSYLEDFENGLTSTDMNCDSGVTVDDLLIYLDEYERGC